MNNRLLPTLSTYGPKNGLVIAIYITLIPAARYVKVNILPD